MPDSTICNLIEPNLKKHLTTKKLTDCVGLCFAESGSEVREIK